jgi:hypothetical protein
LGQLFWLLGGAALVLACLVKVLTLDHCNRTQGMFTKERWRTPGEIDDEVLGEGKV